LISDKLLNFCSYTQSFICKAELRSGCAAYVYLGVLELVVKYEGQYRNGRQRAWEASVEVGTGE
jgi:hypothetical protein